MNLRCVSLHQPWASLVAIGVKTIETRSWSTKHRGRIGLATTAEAPQEGQQVGDWCATFRPTVKAADVTLPGRWLLVSSPGPPTIHVMPLGALVATANLTDVVPIIDDDTGPRCVLPHFSVSPRCYGYLFPAEMPDMGWYPPEDEPIDRSDQLPYGDFRPGRWAWLLDDVKATTERCPACWSEENNRCDDPLCEHCDTCGGKGGCEPIPVKGHQGLWTWDGDT